MWLYVPNCGTSRSAPEEEASTSPSSWQFQALAQSAWWRGKPMPPPFWSRRCAKDAWLRRLCGAMPEPLMAVAGVDKWMASLAASRANPTPKLGDGSAPTTSATSGLPPGASSCSLEPGLSSSKTSEACSTPEAPSVSTETFDALVSRLRLDFSGRTNASRRRWSVHLMSASVSSSSRWQTPSVASATGGQANRGGDRQNELLLAGQARDVSSRLALTISSPGSNTLPRTRTLNPQFVEALMAWPTGWSAFAYSETELSRWKADMRSVISRLPLPTRAPERQPDLFS